MYLFLACNKNNEQAASIDPDTRLIQDAKNYFLKEVLPDKLTQNPIVERNNRLPLGKIANWRMANVQDLRWGKTVVVPLNLPNTYTTTDMGGTKQSLNGTSFLVVYSDKNKVKQADVVLLFPDKNSKKDAFSGTIIVEDWDGAIKSGYKYENGREYNVVTTVIDKRKRNVTTEQTCITTDWYNCVKVGSYPTDCHYNYSTTQCTSGGNTGGGGGGCNCWPAPLDPETVTISKEELLESFDQRANQLNLPACARNIFNKLLAIRTGEFATIIDNFTGQIATFSWTLVIGDAGRKTNANTNNLPYRESVISTFDERYLKAATDLSIARTMLHEGIHAWLVNAFKSDAEKAKLDYPKLFEEFVAGKTDLNEAHHNEIVRSFINDIAHNLELFGRASGYVLNSQYYADMAWGGLQTTRYFMRLPQADQDRINAILEAEQTASSVEQSDGTTVSPKGKRACN